MNVTIVIPNWNGKHFLEKCMPSVLKAVEVYGEDCEIIVVDNHSTDSSIDFLRRVYPLIRIIALRENLGFAKGMNIGIRNAKQDIIIGLNNDIIAHEGFIMPLIRHFLTEKRLFAVGSKMLLWDERTLNFGRAVGSFRLGIFQRKFQEPQITKPALYACGGAFAVDKKKFLQLGGFDEDMIAYWEDLDLCYRAWKQGYKTLYEPKSIVYHKRHGTYEKKCGIKGIRLISGENYFLFSIKNFHDKTLFFQQLLSLPLLLLISPLLNKPHFSLGLIRSLKRWPLFFKKRRQERQKAVFSDRKVLAMSGR